MNTKVSAVMFLSCLLFPGLFAGMERTDECNDRINELTKEIKGLSDEIRSNTEIIQPQRNKVSKLKKEINDFSGLPLVPEFIINWKIGSQKKELITLEGELEKQEADLSGKMEKKGGLEIALDAERSRLKPFKKVVITSIRIKAEGEWDKENSFFKKPDIRLKLKSGRTGQTSEYVVEEQEDASFFVWGKKDEDIPINTGNIDEYDQLVVYDIDDDDKEENMGTIDLEKNKIEPQYGVSGDSKPREINSPEPLWFEKGKIEYSIKYTVYY